MSIVLIDARSDSLTVTWPATTGASSPYILEYKPTDQDDFQELSSQLTQTQARKRNLTPETSYLFRVKPAGSSNGDGSSTSWISHKEPFQTLSTADDQSSMKAPAITNGGNQALVISWTKVDNADNGYELQMRENDSGKGWTTIAPSLKNTEVKKKNLTSKLGYQFRVRPVGSSTTYSPPSDIAVAKGLSQAMSRWFQNLENGTLLRSGVDQPVPLADALGGKEFVLLYASAHWCGPCRQFTPQLVNWYKTNKNYVEIVFLSADHDENSFKSYFSTMPWTAVDYDDDTREQLMAAIKVTGIPRLVVIRADTGKIVENNAVGQPMDLNRWRTLSKQ